MFILLNRGVRNRKKSEEGVCLRTYRHLGVAAVLVSVLCVVKVGVRGGLMGVIQGPGNVSRGLGGARFTPGC